MEKKFNIYTKTGDDGTSGLIGGTRVKKSDLRLEAYGTVDELNSWIGILKSGQKEDKLIETLISVQNNLFVIGSYLATDETKSDLKDHLTCCADDITLLEKEIDRMQEILPPLNQFILPGGSIFAGYAHVARTICRRAERRIVGLGETIVIENNILVFINRLSDYLFVLSRYINHLAGFSDIFWKAEKS